MNIQQRQEKIQEKRKQTSFRDFIRECGTRRPMNFYKNRGCISRYPQSDRVKNVVSVRDYISTRDTVIQYFQDYSGIFFDDMRRLLQRIPIAATNQYNSENCDYSDASFNVKNVYLSMVTTRGAENVAYSFITKDSSKNIFCSVNVLENSENVYASGYIIQSYNVFFSENIINSNNIRFCTNCIGCSECIDCDGLENASYCIANKSLEKEVYLQEKKRVMHDKERFQKVKGESPINIGCSRSDGNNLYNCHDISNGHYCVGVNKANNVVFCSSTGHVNNFSDVFIGGRSTNFYGVCDAGGQSDNCYNITQCGNCVDMYYCMFCEGCSFCLGCIGLENKQFCILNKQYSKDERYAKVDEIFSQMERDGQLGEFFPPTMNPFYFNDTAAYLIDPSFTKEEVTKLGYLRRDEPIKVDIPEGAVTVKSSELGNYEGRITDEKGEKKLKLDQTVCKRVIIDEQGDAYRIIPMELEFLQKHGLPLPRKHWLARMKENFRIG